MSYNDSSYGDFWRDLGSHASNLPGSRVIPVIWGLIDWE